MTEEPVIGDLLIVVDDKPLPGNTLGPDIIKGDSHYLKDILICQCGQKHYNVGTYSILNFIRCYSCGENLPDDDNVEWCHPSRFLKKKEFRHEDMHD